MVALGFVTDATTVFVMDTSRSADVAAGQLGIDRDNHSWRPAAAWSSPRTSTRPTSRWPASTAWTRCGALLISGGISCGPGRSPRGARRLVRRVDRADRGAVPGTPRAGGHHTGHRRLPARPGPLAAAFTDIDAHRILQASDAAKGLLHPAAAKVIATLSNEWDGLARHRSCRSCAG